jgi:hypothetical protein
MRKRCFSLLAILGGVLLALGRTEARQAVTTNLAAYWPMDTFASNSTPDASGNGHAATQATAASQPATATGMFGGALTFDDTADFLSSPDSPGLNVGTGSFTVAAWVKPSGTTADRVLNKWNGTIGWLFDINTGNGGAASPAAVRLKMSDGTNTVDQSTNASLVAGAWTHVAATVDRTSKELKFYANGVQIGTTVNITALTGTLTNAASLGIGTIPSALGNYYGGALDEVRLYTAALTQAQVLTMVQSPPPSGLTATPVAQTIDLSWTASAGAMSYRVYRSTTPGSGYAQLVAGLTGTTYTDTTIAYDVTYYYVVRAFALVEGANSNEASALAISPPKRTQKVGGPDKKICGMGAGGVPGWTALIAGLAALAMVLAASRRSA